MKYKGIELKDIADIPQLINPPRDMLVWSNGDTSPLTRLVLAITANEYENLRVITENAGGGCERFAHCAEIPEEQKKQVTRRQLSRWLAEGNGEYTFDVTVVASVTNHFEYWRGDKDKPLPPNARIRKWDDTEWHEPTLEYMGLEG